MAIKKKEEKNPQKYYDHKITVRQSKKKHNAQSLMALQHTQKTHQMGFKVDKPNMNEI